MIYKKDVKLSLVILFILLIGFSVITNKTKAEIKVIKIAGDNNFPPYEYVDASGNYKGFNVDIMRAIALEMGVEIEIIPMNWNDAIKALENKEVDAIEGMTYDEKRAILFSFTEPITTNTQNIFVLKDNQYISDLKDLEGRKVSFQKGDVSEELIRDYINIIKIPMNNQEDALEALLKNDVDAFVGNRLSGIYYSQKNGNTERVKIVGEEIYSNKCATVTLKENKEVFDILNTGIIRIKNNGIYNKIYIKWFGEEFINAASEHKKIIILLAISLGVILFIIILVAFLSIKLKSMVDLRTKEINDSNIKMEQKQEELLLSTKELKKSEEKFRTIFEQAPFGITLGDSITGKMYEVNSRYAEIVGRSVEEIKKIDWMSITHPEDIKKDMESTTLLSNNNIPFFNMKKRIVKPDGSLVWINMKNASFKIEEKESFQHICIIEDITEIRNVEESLKQSEYTFRKLYDDSADAIFLMEDYKIIDCNNAALELFGYKSKSKMINKHPWEVSPENQLDGIKSKEKTYDLVERVEQNKKVIYEWCHLKSDGSILPVEAMMTSIMLNKSKVFHVLLRDITGRKEMEKKLEYLSYHDILTGIYNRRYFEEELKRLDSERNYPLTIVMADVNGLKLINDSFGHSTGDELLKIVAQIIKEGLRSDDILARLGGDEFVILLPKTSTFETEKVINRIRNILLRKKIGGIDISVSFGYDTKLSREVQIKDVFKKAEDFMYKKKLFESPSMRSKTVQVIIKTLHEKNKREEKHSHRVSELARSLGLALNLVENEIEELKTVGLLHDIGKIAIDENILNKPGRLTSEEWEEIKRHPEIGYRILNTSNDMLEIANYVLYHHEKLDGTGYPKGLKGDEIPLQSKIIAIADTYDAITSERSYRNALSEEIAIGELKKYSGIQFDGKLVKVFIEEVLGKSFQ